MAAEGLNWRAIVVLFLATWVAAAAAAASDAAVGDCESQADCGSCLRTPHCFWCASYDPHKSRCIHERMRSGSRCEDFSWGPKMTYEIVNNGTNKSQLYPQEANLHVRVGETKRINVTFKSLEDYPIDLYFLMDMSATMLAHKTTVSALGSELALAMGNVTRNFRLGFGSFVDKVKMPFVNTHPAKLASPCPGCAKPYSFKNHLALDKDTEKFSKKLNETPVSGSIDGPEGGFDALMQAIVCKEKIKWRSDARHLLVFTTDDIYHIAGDGKLAGAVEPNPEECILNDENEYVGYADYDYPTISQINRKAIENKINIIFAVTKRVEKQYAALQKPIKGSKMVVLSKNSDNIIKILTDVYNEFENSVKLLDDAGSRGIGIIYYSRCSNATGTLLNRNECNNVNPNLPVKFEVDITVKACPSNLGTDTWNTTVNISPHGINEAFKLNLMVYCSCPCEFETHWSYKKNSSDCEYCGALKCGVCEYDDTSASDICECKLNPKEIGDAACTSDDGKICSGHGSCMCGQCLCDKRSNHEIFYGKHCQCDNFSCLRFNGMLCSGRGQCSCGKCDCNVGWSGDACECLEMETDCFAHREDRECSGFGRCVCGKCMCNEGRKGKYCGDCMNCPGGRCKEFADCVECQVHETGKFAGSLCSSNCSLKDIQKEDSISETNLQYEEKYCKVPDDVGCSFVFTYIEEGKNTILRAVKTKECPLAANLIGISLGIGGTTLFLGILGILIWKLLTTIHDRREYAKYEEELENTKWAAVNNPEYQEPTTTTVNPVYGRRSRFSFMMR